MAITYKNYNVDPFNADTPDYQRLQTAYYGGSEANFTAPAAANYPASGSTRYFLEIPYIIDVSDLAGSRPIALRDVTGAVTLTRVTGSPGANQYRVSPATSERRGIIELHSGQAGNTIGADLYHIGGQLRAEDINNISITGNIGYDGRIVSGGETSPDSIAGGATYLSTTSSSPLITYKRNSYSQPMTSFGEADTFLQQNNVLTAGSSSGGLFLRALSGDTAGVEIQDFVTGEVTSLSTWEDLPYTIRISKNTGTSVTSLGNTAYIFSVSNNGDTTKALYVLGDGSIQLTGDIGTTSDANLIQLATNAVTINGRAISTLGIVTQIDTTNVSNPPTDAELDSIFTSPASKGAGWVGIVDDNNAGLNYYIISSDGTNWWYTLMTKAV
jgi:hypothetical protein